MKRIYWNEKSYEKEGKVMDKYNFEERDIPMKTEVNAAYCDVPVVARSPSYQQPVEEAVEQTREALRQRT